MSKRALVSVTKCVLRLVTISIFYQLLDPCLAFIALNTLEKYDSLNFKHRNFHLIKIKKKEKKNCFINLYAKDSFCYNLD